MKYIFEQIKVIKENDPSIHSIFEVLLTPCFRAMLYYRIAHFLYIRGHYFWARYLSYRAKRKTGIEIHPGAVIGKNLFSTCKFIYNTIGSILNSSIAHIIYINN